MTSSSNVSEIVLFPLSSLVTGPGFMSISSLVLKLWQFSFIRDWSEIRKSQTPLSEFCPIFVDFGELGIPYLARMSLMKCYWMLQGTRVTTVTVSELLREYQQKTNNKSLSNVESRCTNSYKYYRLTCTCHRLLIKFFWETYFFYWAKDTD